MPKLKLVVNEDEIDIRADQYLASNLPLSRSQIQKLIKENKITLNNDKLVSKVKTKFNDIFDIEYEEKTLTDIKPENIPLNVIYEDEYLIVVNKEKGMVVHPAPGNYEGTLVNALLYHCKELSDVNGYYRPGIVNRIDKDTSGLIVCAKDNKTHESLSNQLADKTCFRKYYALVNGVIENDEGMIDAPIGRDQRDRQKMCVTDINSKEAITLFNVIERFMDATLLDVELKTGRTHQIRVHMRYINHPIINDKKYGKRIIDDNGQMLHAYYLSFIHPHTNEIVEFKTDIPDYMNDYFKVLRNEIK